MTVGKSTRRVYSAEELYRLRGTSSQPKLREAIEEHEGEDAELVKGKFATACIAVSQSWHSNTTAYVNRTLAHMTQKCVLPIVVRRCPTCARRNDGGLAEFRAAP